MDCLVLDNISKAFGGRKILNDISITVEKGDILGFVGPNGAGKTTTIRIITDLVRPDGGSVTICGDDLKKEREKALSHVSAIVESPSLYKYLSGMEHMEFVRKMRGISKEIARETVEDIGLAGRINDKTGKYSLGMKQRLALGMALLVRPELLILDEPTNGLDPGGISEMRRMLSKLNQKYGMSILISSHNLSEIRKLCTRTVFIKSGRIVAAKSYEHGTALKKYRLEIENSNMETVRKLAGECPGMVKNSIDGSYITFEVDKNGLENFMACLIKNNISFANIESLSGDKDIEDDYNDIYTEDGQ